MEGLLNLSKAAEILAINTDTLRRLIADGEIEACRVGRQFRISKEKLARFIDTGGGGGFRRATLQ